MRDEILIGPAGWSYADWKGIVYPTHRPPGFHEAEYLAGFFSTIEIDSSFYRPPRPQVSRVWARKLGGRRGFRFTAKLYRGFTHEGVWDRDDVRAFREGFEPLAEAGLLGCVLMQFPWSFRLTKENLRAVERLARTFGGYPLAFEARHASWNSAAALDALEDWGVAFCNIDQPQMNQCLPPTTHVTSEIGYVRLHGRNYAEWFNFDAEPRSDGRSATAARYDYLYGDDQIARWSERIAGIASRTKTTYVVTNNHFRGQAVVNALQILARLTGDPVDAPPMLVERYPELEAGAFRASARSLPPQRSLFEAPRAFGIGAVYARA